MTDVKKPYVLIILDGWGYREATESNAILAAETPTLDKLWAAGPKALVSGSGMDVGLPDGQMGNSEVGHMSLGAGRVVYQNFTRISKAIETGEFAKNPVLNKAITSCTDKGKALHIMGLLSPGGVHSHEDQIAALIDHAIAQGAKHVYLHAFLDGRDTPPRSAASSIERFDQQLKNAGIGHIASLVGRYYAMDRDNRWERVQSAYDMLTGQDHEFTATDAASGLAAAYERGEDDEFVKATLIDSDETPAATIKDGDSVVFMNFRADRAREITRAFVDTEFDGFTRRCVPQLSDFVMATEYASDINTSCAFPTEPLTNTLGEYLANLGKTQLRIAETEKYAHVTFFFSGGKEDCYDGEERILIPSPDVATYDIKPEMSAPEVTDKLVEAIENQQYDVIVCNYANGDMVGHTGVFNAAVQAAEAVDTCLKRVLTALDKVGGECLITADHGNAEQMADPNSGQAHTAHTCEKVPLFYVGPKNVELSSGTLPDIAPSLLSLMGIPQPTEMTGSSLVSLQPSEVD